MTKQYFFDGLPMTIRGFKSAMDALRSGPQVLIGPMDTQLISITGLYVRADPDEVEFFERLESLFKKRRIRFTVRQWENQRS